jgi:hypothetical protein
MDQCKSTLSALRQDLLQTMQQIHFGKIEGLIIRGGEPCSSPAPKITQEIKLGGEAAEPKGPAKDDFALKRHATDLFDQFDRLPDGAVVTISVRHGLPALMTLTRSA